ncbi:Fbox domain containing protein [Acanthamoeba castellanii str. Neff]|uniref:Fbox domain containing protein n=1 Tax=Acanthamoeba castellanii (strain ATCC 30010 / Neff) TaxID=1257118 RepID=L8GNQ3_ACACF|nr:Fbox domain containing protein [Acanthamoeba castellanii str. Neff]ELR14494.1 Fbox domain containing protein [Acanthamoeba castellanii str. Neff]
MGSSLRRASVEDQLTELPDEILLGLLAWLGPRDLLACGATNQRLRGLALDNSFWRKACEDLDGSSSAGPATQGNEVVWWREYFEIKRSSFLQRHYSVGLGPSKKEHRLLADTLEELVLASDHHIVLVPHSDTPPTRQEQLRQIPVAEGIRDVVYSEGAILCLTAQDKLNVYDLASLALLKGMLAVYDRSRGWDAPPKWTKVMGNKYSAPPSLALDPSSHHVDGGVLVVFSASWQVYRLADGVGLGPAFKLPAPSAAATPLNHPMMAGRGMLGGESASHFMRPRRTTAFFTPDHIICALSGTIRVIWKASLCEGTAPQFVDKLASSEWQSSAALLVTLAGNEILCWQLPAKWQEELELLHGRPLTHPNPEVVSYISGLCCDSHRVLLSYVVPEAIDTSSWNCRRLAKYEVAVFSLGRWSLHSRLPLREEGQGRPHLEDQVVDMMSLPRGRAALLTKSVMWGRKDLSTLQHTVTFLDPRAPTAQAAKKTRW